MMHPVPWMFDHGICCFLLLFGVDFNLAMLVDVGGNLGFKKTPVCLGIDIPIEVEIIQ